MVLPPTLYLYYIVISDKSDTLRTDETLRKLPIDSLNLNWNDYTFSPSTPVESFFAASFKLDLIFSVSSVTIVQSKGNKLLL